MVRGGSESRLGIGLFVTLPCAGCDAPFVDIVLGGVGLNFEYVNRLWMFTNDDPPPGFLEVPIGLEVPWFLGGIGVGYVLGGFAVGDGVIEGILPNGGVGNLG